MAQGSLVPVFERNEFKGYVVYDAVFPSVQLGQSTLTVFSSSFAVLEPDVDTAIIDATLSVGESKPAGFRVTCNGVTITREFKPLMCVERNEVGGRICRVVYDITPIVRSKPASTITIAVENYGMSTITLEHLAVTVLYKKSNARTNIRQYGGVLVLEPGEAVRLPPLEGPAPLEARIVAYVPPGSWLTVGGRKSRGAGFAVYDFSLGGTNTFEIGYMGRSDVFPRDALVASVLLVRGIVPRPVIDASARRIGSDRVEVRVKNTGSAPVDKLIVVALNKGLVVDRKVVDSIAPSREEVIELKASSEPVIVRVIWRELNELKLKEFRIQ